MSAVLCCIFPSFISALEWSRGERVGRQPRTPDRQAFPALALELRWRRWRRRRGLQAGPAQPDGPPTCSRIPGLVWASQASWLSR